MKETETLNYGLVEESTTSNMPIYKMINGKEVEITEEERNEKLKSKGYLPCKCGRGYYDSKKYRRCLECVVHPLAH